MGDFFGNRFFAKRYFPAGYFQGVEAEEPPVEPEVPAAGVEVMSRRSMWPLLREDHGPRVVVAPIRPSTDGAARATARVVDGLSTRRAGATGGLSVCRVAVVARATTRPAVSAGAADTAGSALALRTTAATTAGRAATRSAAAAWVDGLEDDELIALLVAADLA